MTTGDSPGDGIVVVDKPGGLTSHDVVARMRAIAGTRKVGHAGTLDPMATGVLVLGINKATRLLGHLTLASKTYLATIRLGQSTVSDDAEGEITGSASTRGVTDVAAGRLSAVGSFDRSDEGQGFLIGHLLIDFCQFPLQHGPDKPTGRIPLLLQIIQSSFQIHRQLDHDSYELGHDRLLGQTPAPVIAHAMPC